jgi:hypothetical protein
MSVDKNRRETFRQDEQLAIKEEFLTPEQFSAEMNRTGIDLQNDGMIEQLMNNDTHSITHDSPEAMKTLKALEQKLNYLISLNTQQAVDAGYDLRPVNLSASGMGFVTQEQCNRGDHLKVKINLPLSLPLKLELLGKVVGISSGENKQNGTRIGISFIYRCKQEQEIIVKYLFKRQRENLREKL